MFTCHVKGPTAPDSVLYHLINIIAFTERKNRIPQLYKAMQLIHEPRPAPKLSRNPFSDTLGRDCLAFRDGSLIAFWSSRLYGCKAHLIGNSSLVTAKIISLVTSIHRAGPNLLVQRVGSRSLLCDHPSGIWMHHSDLSTSLSCRLNFLDSLEGHS